MDTLSRLLPGTAMEQAAPPPGWRLMPRFTEQDRRIAVSQQALQRRTGKTLMRFVLDRPGFLGLYKTGRSISPQCRPVSLDSRGVDPPGGTIDSAEDMIEGDIR